MNAITERKSASLQAILGIVSPMSFINNHGRKATAGIEIAFEIMSCLAESIISSGGVRAYINRLCLAKNKVLHAQGLRMKEAISCGKIPEYELAQAELSIATMSILAMAQMPDSKTDLILFSALLEVARQSHVCDIKESMLEDVFAIAQYLEGSEAAASHRMVV